MKKQNFIDYDIKRSIKINLITSGIYILLVALGFILLEVVSNFEKKKAVGRIDAGLGFLVILFSMILILQIALAIYSVFLPLFLKLHSTYIDNLKNFIGIFICNFAAAFYLKEAFGFRFALNYILIVILGLFVTLTLKYYLIKKKIGLES
ncbi:hypothetical protein [Clostridium polynesiense]|uniref:hypothetical protein n=1 Tax=Clostridium polynesiense TaxID=1325933 RepID=UPI000590501B|nr:hypothetical protein [Clostridium polynesiense]